MASTIEVISKVFLLQKNSQNFELYRGVQNRYTIVKKGKTRRLCNAFIKKQMNVV